MDKGSAIELKEWICGFVALKSFFLCSFNVFSFAAVKGLEIERQTRIQMWLKNYKVLPGHVTHVKSTPLICHLCVMYCATALFYGAFLFPLLSSHRGLLDQLPSWLDLSWCSSCVEPSPTVRRSRILSTSTSTSTSTLRGPNLLWRGHLGPGLCVDVLHQEKQVWGRQVRRRGPGHGKSDQIRCVLQLFCPSLWSTRCAPPRGSDTPPSPLTLERLWQYPRWSVIQPFYFFIQMIDCLVFTLPLSQLECCLVAKAWSW